MLVKNAISVSCLLGSALWALSADAEELRYPTVMPANSVLGLAQNIELIVDDQVSDNCWTNSSSIRSSIFLLMEQNDMRVLDYEPAFNNWQTPRVVLAALGGRSGNGQCYVSGRFLVYFQSSITLGGTNGGQEFRFPTLATVFETDAVFLNSGNANDQLGDFLNGAASEYLARVISSRRSEQFEAYLEAYPPHNDLPISTADWQEYLDSLTGSDNN